MPSGDHPNSRKNLKPFEPGDSEGRGGARNNAGRPKNEVVQACRLAFEERIPVLMQIADSPRAKDRDRIAAIDKLGEYGGLKKIDVTSGDQPIVPTVTIEVVYADPVDPSETA